MKLHSHLQGHYQITMSQQGAPRRKRHSTTFFMLFVLLSILATSAATDTFFISSSTGDDTGSGASPSSPWRTLARAAAAVNGGAISNATVLLLSGDAFTLPSAAFFQGLSNFTLASYGPSLRRPVLERPAGSAAGPTLTFDNCTGVAVRGLEVRGGEVGIAFTFGAGGAGPSDYAGNLEVTDNYFEGIRGLNYSPSSGQWWGAAVALAAGRWPVRVRGVVVANNIVNGSDTFFKNEVPWSPWVRVELSAVTLENNTLLACGYNCLFLDSVSDVLVSSNVFLADTPPQLFVAGTTDIIMGTLNASVVLRGNEMSKRGEFQPGGPDGCAVDFETNATGVGFFDNYVSRAFGAGVMVFGHADDSNTNLHIGGNKFLFNGCGQTRGDHGGIAFMHKRSSGTLVGNIMATCPGVALLNDALDPGLPGWLIANNTVDGEGGVTLAVAVPPTVAGTPQSGGGLLVTATHPQPDAVVLRYSEGGGGRPGPTSPIFPEAGLLLPPNWRAVAVLVKAFPIAPAGGGIVPVESECAGSVFAPPSPTAPPPGAPAPL